MKATLLFSTVLVTIFFGSTNLLAGSYSDSVSSQEAKAVAHPSSVKGKAAARAEIEETGMKEEFVGKMDREKFANEAQKDKSKKLQKH
ncbi:hypothetical protein [Sulfurimonas sp.]